MTYQTSDRPSSEELYILATNTSDLTLNPDRTCSATHLIAAGLLGNRMGQALVHLRSEWDGSAKPRKATEDEITFRAALLLSILGVGHKGKPDVKRARGEALVMHATAMRHRAHQLVGWTRAMALLIEWAEQREVDRNLLSPALYHFLNPTCPMCDGRGAMRMPDAPALGKQCPHCRGVGKWPRPLGAQQVHDWLASCQAKAKRERSALVRGAAVNDFATGTWREQLRKDRE
jgi:hypothetical protein